MARYNGMGWHNQSIRHSNARKYGKAGGTYAKNKERIRTLYTGLKSDASSLKLSQAEEQEFLKLLKENINYVNLEMYKGETIGQTADEMADDYFKIYLILKNDKDAKLRARAEGLAEHDLLVRQVMTEFAQKKLKQLIAEDKAIEEQKK